MYIDNENFDKWMEKLSKKRQCRRRPSGSAGADRLLWQSSEKESILIQ